MSNLKSIRLKSVMDADWKQIWKIYESSFPDFEIRTKETQKRLLSEKDYYCTAILEYDELVGILFYWETDRMNYIEHLAIHPDKRGQDYGSQIMNNFCDTEKLTLLEIDPPEDEISKKRLRFYENLGFVMNDYHFVHPSFLKEQKHHKLMILSYPNKVSQKDFDYFLEYLDQKVLSYSEC